MFDGSLRIGTVFPLLAIRGGRDLEIFGNEVRAAKGTGIESFAEGSVNPDGVRIVGNWVHDGFQGIVLHAGAGTLIGSNLIDDHSDIAVSLDPTMQQTFVVSNTFARARVGVVVGASSSAIVAGTHLMNNVFTDHREQAIFVGTKALGNEARHNAFFGNADTITGALTESDSTTADPQYVAVRDFHLRPTSTAIGSADLTFTPAVDRDGRCRPIGAPDRGAFEQ